MPPTRSVSWNDAKKGGRRQAVVLAALSGSLVAGLGSLSAAPAYAASTPEGAGASAGVVVRATHGSVDTVAARIRALGGHVTRTIALIDGVAATVPANAVPALQRSPGVVSVTPDAKVTLHSVIDGYDADADGYSMPNIAKQTGAFAYYNAGITGKGVDVAVIDSGVAPVKGLDGTGKVVYGADLSFDSQSDNLRYLDGFGHGTHLAGIIAGKDPGLTVPNGGSTDLFNGVAPDARIVSVKVADSRGLSDVSQVLAGVDWVVQHRRDNGMNIRVLNLSFGTDSAQSYLLDPLAYAAEVAWRSGIVVVVSAGNSGGANGRLTDPAIDPYVLAVGADDTKGTMSRSDDTIPSFSSTGDGVRNPDLVAPGKSVVSLRVPNGYIDANHSGGRVNSRFFRGSGTSQAAAVVAGAAALVIQQRPSITPDQVKDLLKRSAVDLPAADQRAQGAGLINLTTTYGMSTNTLARQLFALSTGTGSLEAARGSYHLKMDGVELTGERDIFGQTFVSGVWAPLALAGTSWSGGVWNSNSWTGSSWSSNSWSSNSWSSNSWSSNSWSSNSWSSNSWSSNSWSSNSWSSNSWSSNSWSSNSWSSNSWSSSSWS